MMMKVDEDKQMLTTLLTAVIDTHFTRVLIYISMLITEKSVI